MAFAHPFETGHRKRPFIDKDETQYCPWVIVHGAYVGIRVYTSSEKFVIEDLTFAFENLKAYIKERYEYLKEMTTWAEQEIAEQNVEWAQHKVKRSEDVFETIVSIKEIYDERYRRLEYSMIERRIRSNDAHDPVKTDDQCDKAEQNGQDLSPIDRQIHVLVGHHLGAEGLGDAPHFNCDLLLIIRYRDRHEYLRWFNGILNGILNNRQIA
jgi:hypothetical protein